MERATSHFLYGYHRPASLAEALEIKAAQPEARFIAGGTDLLVRMRKRAIPIPPALVSLRSLPELTIIETLEGGVLRIGAAAPVSDVAAHPVVRERYPALHQALRALGSRQIQNQATLGGNLCRASPCADSAPPLLVYEARAQVHSVSGAREVPLDKLFRGPGHTVLEPEEIMTAVLLEPPEEGCRSTFRRKGRVQMDLSIANLALLLQVHAGRCTRARVAAGSVAPVPMRCVQTEAVLEGSGLDDATVERARSTIMAEVMPVTDVRSTEAYRRHIVGVYLARGVRRLVEAAPGREEEA